MRQVWAAVLGVLSVVAIACVVVVGAEVFQVKPRLRALVGTNAPSDRARPVGPPPAMQGNGDEGALDLVVLDWMKRDGVQVRFPGGRAHALPLFTRVPAGMYMLEFYSATHKSVLCQVQVNPRRRSHVTFGGDGCRVVQND